MSAAYTCVARYPYGTFVKNYDLAGRLRGDHGAGGSGLRPTDGRAGVPRRQRHRHRHFRAVCAQGHSLDRVRVEARALLRDTPPRPACVRLHGISHRQRAQPAGNADRRRLCAGTDRRGDLRHRAHRLARGAADGADGEHHLLARAVAGVRRKECSPAPHAAPSRLPTGPDHRGGHGCRRDDGRAVLSAPLDGRTCAAQPRTTDHPASWWWFSTPCGQPAPR